MSAPLGLFQCERRKRRPILPVLIQVFKRKLMVLKPVSCVCVQPVYLSLTKFGGQTPYLVRQYFSSRITALKFCNPEVIIGRRCILGYPVTVPSENSQHGGRLPNPFRGGLFQESDRLSRRPGYTRVVQKEQPEL